MTHIIETHQLTKAYSSLKAVDKLDITVESGEIFGLLGPNGAGKTTTISMLCTILKPTSGTATVNGYDIVKEANKVRKSIGIVFQEPSIDDRLTGRENLYMHANLYGVPASEQKERIDRILNLVELDDRADDLLRTYSGGMRRRLELGRGLIHYPKVLFLDEPTVGLDPQTRDHIWKYIRDLKEAQDITVVLTTHYMDEADRLSDRIAIMDHGKIVILDTPPKLKETLEGDVVAVKANNIDALSELVTKWLGLEKKQIVDGTLEITVRNGKAVMPRIMELATQNNIYVESILLREPNLEDVFLHYTGRTIREDSGKELHGMAAIHRRANKMSEIRGFYTLWLREIKRFLRDRTRIVSSFVQPLLWLVIFGAGFGLRFTIPGLSYQQVIFPGIVGQTLLFTSMFMGISVIWDKEFGFMKEILGCTHLAFQHFLG